MHGRRMNAAVITHLARLGVLAAIAVLAHAVHLRRSVDHEKRPLAGPTLLAAVQRHLPPAASFGVESAEIAGGRELLDTTGALVGIAVQTSPAGDAAIGFSGPTDLLLVCDPDLVVRGVEILASRDTRDHARAVERDPDFLASFCDRPLDSLAAVGPRAEADAVAGATLTSYAIRDAIALRLGGELSVSRFGRGPMLADLQLIYPAAASCEQDAGDPAVIRVADAGGGPLGFAIRTSPAADRVVGYQGPTDAVVGFDSAGRVCGIVVLESFDNEPYVGYVREDRPFRGLWRGMTIEELAAIDAGPHAVEGVSGATMTSQAVAEGILRAVDRYKSGRAVNRRATGVISRIDGPQWATIAVILVGVVTAFTRLRGGWFGRLGLPVLVIGWLGLGAGALLSQAQLWGWTAAGVPAGATVLAVLTAVALLSPATTRRNVYCGQLCPHGAAQQLLLRVPGRRSHAWLSAVRSWGERMPAPVRRVVIVLPWLLLTVAILATVLGWPLPLVDLEPFDAWLPAVAGTWPLVFACSSLLVSAVWPMAYCRHGCPTGALLSHVRLHRRSDRITWRDGVLVACLAVAALVWLGGR